MPDLVPVLVLERAREADDEAFTYEGPETVGEWANRQVVGADVIGDLFVEAGLESSEAIVGVRFVDDLVARRCATEVIACDAVVFHPFDNFPLEEVARSVGSSLTDAGAIFVGAFVAEISTKCASDDFALEAREK